MKRNRSMEKGIMICMFSFSLFIPSAAAAQTEENTDVAPNQYEKKDIEIDTNYLHEDTYYEEKTELPEEQKDITFDKPKDKDAELIKICLHQQMPRIPTRLRPSRNSLELHLLKNQ